MTAPEPTQVKNPGRTVLRTGVQSAVGMAVVIVALQADGLLPQTLPWIGGGFAAALTLARIMAHPAVNRWLRSVGLSAD